MIKQKEHIPHDVDYIKNRDALKTELKRVIDNKKGVDVKKITPEFYSIIRKFKEKGLLIEIRHLWYSPQAEESISRWTVSSRTPLYFIIDSSRHCSIGSHPVTIASKDFEYGFKNYKWEDKVYLGMGIFWGFPE